MSAVNSQLTKFSLSWEDRINAMKEDLKASEFFYLGYKIYLNLFDAQDNADYQRESILKQMLKYFKRKDEEGIWATMRELEDVE